MANATLQQTVSAIVSLVVNDKLPMRKQVEAKLALSQPVPLALDMSLYGQATNDAKKVLAASKVPVVVKTLDSPLVDLFIAGSLDKTMYRYDKKLMELIRNSTGFTPPQERSIQKLVTALAQVEHQGLLGSTGARAITVRQFLVSGQVGQMATIDSLWDECTLPGVYDKETSEMHEPDNAVNERGDSQLPSSVHPIRVGAEAKTFKRGRGGSPFTELGIGFRVEGSFDRTKGETADKVQKDIQRVSSQGMVPQITLDFLMLNMGKDVSGTKVSTNVQVPRLNRTQKDLWNESGVCVARSFFGSSAFPLRNHEGGAVMWALNVANLQGMDTEDWQLGNRGVGDGPWRPGEKCYRRILQPRILAWVMIDKQGDGGSGWKFAVAPDAKWTFINYPAPSHVKYLQDELAAWAGVTASVNTYLDFQQ